MTSNSENIVYSRNILEFITVSAEYTSYLENFSESPRKDFVFRIHKILTLLYLKASLLNELEPAYDSTLEKFFTEEDWNILKDSIAAKLGGFDIFVDVVEPDSQIDGEVTSVSLSECLTDVYQDLFDFVNLYQIGSLEIMNDAIWECKQNFEQYWGPRLLVVLSAFHNMIYSFNTIDEED